MHIERFINKICTFTKNIDYESISWEFGGGECAGD